MKSIKGSMDTKVFCKGSQEFKKVITKLKEDGLVYTDHISDNPEFYVKDRYFALSIFAEREGIPNKLGNSSNYDFYPKKGYIEASPQEFDKWWRSHFCKDNSNSIKVIESKFELPNRSKLTICL